jgi:RNA polymerase sigma-70 factor (ECF subfamily)
MNEAELLVRAVATDVDAFTALIRLHDDRLRAYAFRLLAGDHALMEDSLQNAYVKAFRSIDRFRGESSFGTWLHRIVHNCCVDELRRRRDHVSDLDDRPDPVDHAAVTVEGLAVASALATLPVHHRAVLILIDAHGFDYRDASDVLGIPIGTVRSRLARARTSFRRALEVS